VHRPAGLRPGRALHLTDSTMIDVCEISRITPAWIGFSYHRDKSCNGNDLVFLPFGTVSRVTLSAHPAGSRTLGFGIAGSSLIRT